MRDIRTIETTDGLYVNLSDILKVMSKMAWVTGCTTLFILHNRLFRGELFNGERHIKSNEGSA